MTIRSVPFVLFAATILASVTGGVHLFECRKHAIRHFIALVTAQPALEMHQTITLLGKAMVALSLCPVNKATAATADVMSI